MKFLTLREAIEKATPVQKPIPVRNRNEPSKPSQKRHELVAGGDILWKPVNKQAAMLLAKSPWWAFDLTKPQNTNTMNTETKQTLKQLTPMTPNGLNTRETPRGIETIHPLTDDELSPALSAEVVKQTKSSLDATNKLLNEALDARAALDIMSERWKPDWIEFMQSSNERLREFRGFRMALDSEMRQLLTVSRDVRKFFMENDHEQEMARLKEFVDLCERLQNLKDSGFLNDITDTILKLSERQRI